ncbi:hypothetical protein FMEAI12_1740013 [Parafrankia sp. Ea1.12]|nr:hypothetical protein FMEAI12_1740013 [Parafrankia sp. Ea1.12]
MTSVKESRPAAVQLKFWKIQTGFRWSLREFPAGLYDATELEVFRIYDPRRERCEERGMAINYYSKLHLQS